MAVAVTILLALSGMGRAAEVVLPIDAAMNPPGWALLQRELLKANTAGCRQFFTRYFDERGHLKCVERWGGDDGPDDAIENCANWPILHALGAPDEVLAMYKKAWEGHLRQFTAAKTTQVPFARDGMYYKEFPVMFDWLHHGEGLCVFNLQGLSDPYDDPFRKRARRFAGFYLNDDAGAKNYDPKHRIIRSMFNGSRGPLLRKATALDWAGDPIEVENRFKLGHGERHYQDMLDHFKDYNDIVGDHPLNLRATTLAANAFMLEQEDRYRRWLLEYVDAWGERMAANNNLIPTNIGLDGKIGGEVGGKWYGGVYGWGFSVKVPQTGEMAHRNSHHLGFQGFMNAYLLTGDDKYLEPWRKQADAVNAQQKKIDDKVQYPTMHGDKGWYNFTPEKYTKNALEIYYLSMRPADRERVPTHAWLEYLAGKNPDFPEKALRRDLENIRVRMKGMRADETTPDTRLADDPLKFNPATVTAMLELAMGGIGPGISGGLLHCRLRYFDAAQRRAGLPEDVAALVDRLDDDSTAVTLVNVNQVEARTVVVQAGAYGEHRIVDVTLDGKRQEVDGGSFTARLAPGAGARLVLKMKRYANPPTLVFPWDRAQLAKVKK